MLWIFKEITQFNVLSGETLPLLEPYIIKQLHSTK